jgi:lipopolysaccharide export system permease protein
MRRLDRYVLSVFVSSYALAFFLLVGLFVVFDAIGQIDDYLERLGEFGGLQVVGLVAAYYALSIPYFFLWVGPFVTLLAAVFTATRLHRNNELVPTIAGGRSLQRTFAPVFVGGLLGAAAMVAAREGALPRTEGARGALRHLLRNGRGERVLENVYARGTGGEKLFADRFYPERDLLEEVWVFYALGENLRYARADRAHFDPARGTWSLEGGEIADFGQEGGSLDALPAVGISPADVLLFSAQGSEDLLGLSFRQVDELARREPARLQYQTLLHFFFTFPLASLLLPLLGLPFSLRLERRAGAEGVVLAAGLCGAYFALDLVLRYLGSQGTLPPLVAAWSPVVLFGSLGIVLFDGMRS